MSFQNIWVICKRELGAFFNSAIAYIFLIVFILISTGLYMTDFFFVLRADMRSFFNTLPVVLCVFIPAVTMRLWAEDRRGNTLELLLTFPMKTHELVLGKFIASLLFYLAALATTFTIPLMLSVLSRPDFGPITASYFGALLAGAFFLAFGMFVSGLCRDQIVAFISSLLVCFGFILAGTEITAASIDGWFPGLGTFLKLFLGLLPHFASFARGVLDLKDILYFVIGTVIFLVLNGFWMEGRMRPKAKTIFTTATVISLGIFILFNWLMGDFSGARLDLTQGKIYTVSTVSKKILKELKAPVFVKYYVSPQEKMPTQMKTLEQEVIDKLQEFRIASEGKFDFKVFHLEAANVGPAATPEKEGETSLESQAEQKGVEPFQVQSVEADQVGLRLVYSAIAIAHKEKPEEIIPQIIPSSLNDLEYLIISKIYRMTMTEIPKVAIMAPYEERQVNPQMAALLAQLGGGQMPDQYREDEFKYLPAALEYAGYETSRIRLTKEEPIPSGTRTLAVAAPENLNDRQRYEINRFLYEGGSVFLAVQNYMFDYQPAQRGSIQIFPKPATPEINTLLKNWGVSVDDSFLMDIQSEVISISGAARMGPFSVSVPVKTPLHIMIGSDGMNENLSITSNLPPVFYLWGSAIDVDQKKLDETGLKMDVLMKTSKESWKKPFSPEPMNQQSFEIPDNGFGGPYPVAVWLRGQFSNVYAERKTLPMWPEDVPMQADGTAPSDPEKLATPAPSLTPKPGQLFLTGAATIFKENMISGGGTAALNLFANAMDAMSLSEDLTQIRSKREVMRSIARPSASSIFLWRFLISYAVPIMLVLVGSFRFIARKRLKQSYLRSIKHPA